MMPDLPDLRPDITELVNSVVEVCAQLAEQTKTGPVYYVDGKPNAQPVIGGDIIAAAIRSLKR